MKKKIVVCCIVICLILNQVGILKNIYASTKNEFSKKSYVLLTEDKSKIKDILKEFDVTEKIENNSTYEVCLNISEQEAELLSDNNEILISENEKVYASERHNEKNRRTIKNKKKRKRELQKEWNLRMINAEEENNKEPEKKVKVAIIDSGVDECEDIEVVKKINLIPGEENVTSLFEDTSGHGTSIAGIIAAKDNGKGIVGINSNVEIYSAKVLDDYNTAPISRVVEGIYWAIENNVDIISLSFGTYTDSEVLKKAIEDASKKGILIIAAAGNGGKDKKVEYPAAYEEVMAVGSVNADGNLSEYSSVGEELEILAPGEKIKSTGSFEGVVVSSGTSMAVPHVVGVASVLWERDLECSKDFVRELIKVSANKQKEEMECGIVDLKYAISIYDDFKRMYSNGYTENKRKQAEKKLSNNGKLEKFSDEVDYVNGSWHDSVHESIAVKATKNIELTANQIKIVKKGAKFPDIQFAGLSENPQWHGGGNYISNYRCITLMALAEGDGKKLGDVHRPKGMNKKHYKKMKKQAESINWTGYDKNNQKVLLGYKNTKKNRELFLWGMAMHAATDVYAHRAYAKISGKWTHLDHYNNNKYADRTDKFETRFLAAKQTARDIMLCYEVGDSGDHWEFVHTKKYYDGTYKLKNLVSYAKQQETLDESNSGIEELKIGNID